MLLSIPPFFFFFDGEEEEGLEEDEGAEEEENLEAYLWRREIFLKRSAASDSEEKAIPIMQSCETFTGVYQSLARQTG